MDHSALASLIIQKTFKDHSKASGMDLSESNVNNLYSLGILAMETIESIMDKTVGEVKVTTIADVETYLEAPLEISPWSEESALEELHRKVLYLLKKHLP